MPLISLSPPLISPVVVVFVLLAFTFHPLCNHVFIFLSLCFTILFTLFGGFSQSDMIINLPFVQHVSDIVVLYSTVGDQKLLTELHCSLCFQSFLTFLTVSAALCKMLCLKVLFTPQIQITACFIPPTWQAHCVESDIVKVL